MSNIKYAVWDNARTPFQCDSTRNAGFTTGRPWQRVNPNYKTVNVLKEEADTNSPLHYFRKMVHVHKTDLTLVYGRYMLMERENPQVYCYTREWHGEKIGVLLNFSKELATVATGAEGETADVLIGNYPDAAITLGGMVKLRPYEAYVYR